MPLPCSYPTPTRPLPYPYPYLPYPYPTQVITKAAPRIIEPEPEEPPKKGMNEKELAAFQEAALARLPPERVLFGQVGLRARARARARARVRVRARARARVRVSY